MMLLSLLLLFIVIITITITINSLIIKSSSLSSLSLSKNYQNNKIYNPYNHYNNNQHYNQHHHHRLYCNCELPVGFIGPSDGTPKPSKPLSPIPVHDLDTLKNLITQGYLPIHYNYYHHNNHHHHYHLNHQLFSLLL